MLRIINICTFSLLFALTANGQVVKDSLGFETFSMTEGDTTYIMKKYFMAFLKTGPNRDHPKEEAEKIQKAHLAHIHNLANNKQLSIAGPFGDDGEIRGIFILNVPDMETAKKIANDDPAVKAGRLVIEIHPWWAAKGSKLD